MKERTPEQLKGQIRSFAEKRNLQSQEVLHMEDIDDPTFLETSDSIMKRNEEAYGELAK